MKVNVISVIVVGMGLLTASAAQAINANYAKQLERSGCTQASELQGCDLKKSKAENAKAGFVTETSPTAMAASSQTPYAGSWVAKNAEGGTVATIRVNAKEQVWVNDKSVKAKRSDGGLMFKVGTIQFFIQGDRRLKDEDYWTDFDAKTKGPIVAK
ncbi:MAG: hypothetical protein IPN53_22280 [Comamonadaceae bacterium]|nr:hypothetical protein [Comamonadaceae bacterium]